MLAKDGTVRMVLSPETIQVIGEWAKKNLSRPRTLISVLVSQNLDYKSLDYFETVRNRRAKGEERRGYTRMFLRFEPGVVKGMGKAATDSRTFVTEWVEELLTVKAKEWKESQNVDKSSNRQSSKS